MIDIFQNKIISDMDLRNGFIAWLFMLHMHAMSGAGATLASTHWRGNISDMG